MFNSLNPNNLTIPISKQKEFMGNPYLRSFFESSDHGLEKIDKTEDITFDFEDKQLVEVPIPSNLRVSTMTAICSVNMNINLAKFFEKLVVYDDRNVYPYIKSCQFGNDNIKGINPKKIKKKRVKDKGSKRNYFQNQATLVIMISKERKVNLKIFRNGKIQMTGLKSKEEGMIACEMLLKELRLLKETCPDILTIEDKDTADLSAENVISNFSIVLINSDFFGGFKIKRDKLYEILSKAKYFVSYEPDIYPGVNAKYFWNKSNSDTETAGICQCTVPCDGKGDGEGNGRCKKITIATFQSGNIIITGARNNQQTMDAYNFINNIFRKNYKYIVRVSNNDKDVTNMYNNGNTCQKIKILPKDVVNFQIRDEYLNKN